ncbi:hypothetical protein SPI_08989 [Niveomyces insectorum RCEF 264]|uniref:Uncharacterized protein n=1 Tax=Niveomyces insectorum RCEF 264 TaxID=1081102 RepID=A0A162MD07_9HYPO|nr:hypothetical protein SPI_08989 [Niveomyces insectorum RCEF 264]
MDTFTIRAAPGTDIWRKPPQIDDFNEKYDQGGILLSLTKPKAGSGTGDADGGSPPKWIKAGVEFYENKEMLSTVACDRWADWSIAALPASAGTGAGAGGSEKTWTTLLVERGGPGEEGTGLSLWVYHVLENGTKTPMREIAWVFGEDGGAGWEVEVTAMAARPDPEKTATTELEVEVRGFDVKWKE